MNGTAQGKLNDIHKSEETHQLVYSFFSSLVLVLITGKISKLIPLISLNWFKCFFSYCNSISFVLSSSGFQE